MKKGGFLVLLALLPLGLLAQTRTINGSGNWSNSGIWTGGNIATTISENVNMQNGTAVTILNGETFNVGNVTDNNNNIITINAGGVLILGASGTPKSLNAGNNTTVTVAGQLIIYGDINVNNNLIFNITGAGSVTVIGNVVMNNNATLAVNGSMAVGGNFTGGNNTSVTVNGSVSVQGSTTMGNGSTLTGTGTFNTHGGCTGPAAFCSSGTLPLRLKSYDVKVTSEGVLINWETVFESDLDKFVIQRSSDGMEFSKVADIQASGGMSGTTYQFVDKQPMKGTSYYRLIAIDMNTTTYDFRVINVRFESKFVVSVYPNPVTDGKLYVNANFGSAYRVMMYDVTGRMISQIVTDQQELEWPLEVASGFYIVRIEGPAYQMATRLIVK